MPDDLLRFVSGPVPYSAGWLWLGLALLAAVIGWYVAVLTWTLPAARLRRIPVIRSLHADWLRRRYARSIRGIVAAHRGGGLSDAQAGEQIGHALRSFLHQATGTRAQYMHLDALAAGELAPAAPTLSAVDDVRFNTASTYDVSEVGAAAEELIRAWN